MKASHYVMLFFIFVLPLVVILDRAVLTLETTTKVYAHYDKLVDNAVYDTLYQIVESDDGTGNPLNREAIARNFYDSLFAGFNISTDSAKQALMKVYIPVIALVEPDGLTLLYNSIVINNGVTGVKQLWTEKIRFPYKETNGTVYLSTNSDVQIIIEGNPNIYSGEAETIHLKYAEDAAFLNYYNNSIVRKAVTNNTEFEAIRRDIVTSKVSDVMTYYVNENNRIAESYGIKYVFTFPQSALDNFDRSIDDPSLFVLFQGYPIGADTKNSFNKVSFGGARSYKDTGIIVKQGTDGLFYYHKSGCVHAAGSEEFYSNRQEAALTGAYACEVCKP